MNNIDRIVEDEINVIVKHFLRLNNTEVAYNEWYTLYKLYLKRLCNLLKYGQNNYKIILDAQQVMFEHIQTELGKF